MGIMKLMLSFLKDQKQYESGVQGSRAPKDELRFLFVYKSCTVTASSLCAFRNDPQMHCTISKAFCSLKLTIDLSRLTTVLKLFFFLCRVACTDSVLDTFFASCHFTKC